MKTLKYFLICVVIWLILFAAIRISGLEDTLVFNPSAPLESFIEKSGGIEQIIKTEDGQEIVSWFYKGDPKKPVIILSHGRSAYDFTLLPLIGILRGQGNTLVAYSYSGYGKSTGKPSEKAIYQDLQSVINAVKKQFNLTDKDIILMGHSMGGAVAIDAASKNAYKALIVGSTFSSIRDVQRYQSIEKPALSMLALLPLKHKMNSAAKVAKVKTPFYMFHSKDDTIAPYYMSEKLVRRNPAIMRFTYNKGNHNYVFWYADDLAAVIKEINNK
ncbi:hypothetical protein AAIR98_000520 [Elusimicrobium simillimum]|uniref:alpha/beta hydrolase n=1 Tax=Elusimicrobium simillimum TaxID=3143438 RepID=UPI003C6FF2B3